MLYSKTLKLAALVGMAAAATVAVAEPGVGVSAAPSIAAPFNDTADADHDRIRFRTKELTDVRVQKLTFAPGSRSGWHHHPGVIIVAVQTGKVTLTDHNCVSQTYGPGEPAGSVFVEAHDDPQQATSAPGAEAFVTIIVPRGAPARIDDDPVTCP